MTEDVLIHIGGVAGFVNEFPGVVLDETENVMRLITGRLESEIMQRTPGGVGGGGGLAGSIAGDVTNVGGSVVGIVGTPFEYGEVVEFGRKPGSFPPIEPIALWARRVLGIGEEEAEGVAHAIAWKIFHHGTEGKFMFRDGWGAVESWAMGTLQGISGRIAGRMNRV